MEAEPSLKELPGYTKRMGTYIGCMFVDHMHLLQHSYGFSSTGPVMTGLSIAFPSPLHKSYRGALLLHTPDRTHPSCLSALRHCLLCDEA